MDFLRVDNVSKEFPNLTGSGPPRNSVLRDVSLTLAKGEFVTTIGHSGCGKSTLLNIIAGFEHASRGTVHLEGCRVSHPGLDRMVVFQNYALMPWFTALQNVAAAVKSAYPDWPKDRIREHAQKYLDMMGLHGAGHKRPAHLSGGMRQRVGLARAFAVEPKVLLLDEPFAQIDALTRGGIQEELIKMWTTTRRTIFLVTHDVDEAILLSDRIALMSNGPGARIEEFIEVKIPRPRTRDALIDMPEYLRLRNHILHFLLRGSHHRAERPGLNGASKAPHVVAAPV